MIERNKKVPVALIVALAVLLSSVVVINYAGDEAEAVKSDRDSGYYYVDSLEPSPKTTYNWIDVQGDPSSESFDMYSSSSYGMVDLTWDFPYYGSEYSRIYVAARGYLCFNSWSYSTSYTSGIPYSGSPNPMIAVMWGYGYGNAYYMEGTTNNIDWLAIEWVQNNYGMHYQVILYESGAFKMQYKSVSGSSYSDGDRHTVGIEDQSGTTGIEYKSFYDQTMVDNMAIFWTFSEATIYEPEVLNAQGNQTKVCYAEYMEYEFSFRVTTDHPTAGANDLNDVRLYFGPPSLGIFARYTYFGGSITWELGGGNTGPGNGTLEVNVSRSNQETNVLSDPWEMKVFVKFTFAFPWEGMIPLTIWAGGEASFPTSKTYDDVFYLDTGVRMIGEFNITGEDGRQLENEDYTMENETITFTGVKLSYNFTAPLGPNATLYPLNSSYYFAVIDDELRVYTDRNVSGREFLIMANMPLRALRKEFRVHIMGIPDERIKGELPLIALRVDDSSPTAPGSLVIRADSFKDKQREVDNDDTLYVSWGSVSDSGSGVKHYKISSSPDPNNESAIIIDQRITQFIWNSTIPGDFTLYVWAEDGVGHVGEMASESIKIDKKDPFFTDFGHDTTQWLRTLTPTLTITARDGYTISEDISGVRKSTAEYAISTTGDDDFREWISAGLFDDETTIDDDVDIKVSPRLEEGVDNYVRFRIKDWAGNGYAVSEAYNLKIDVTPVSFQEFFPTQDVWHNIDIINSKEISVYLVDQTSGVDTSDIHYRISHELDENGNYIWSTGIQPEGGWQEVPNSWYDRVDGNNRVWIHFPYEDFQEGELNFIQFLAKDNARTGQFTGFSGGPWTQSPLFQVLVNTKPVAIISEPENFNPATKEGEFNITELITFDASDSYDIDVDAGNLKFEWREGNKTLSTDMVWENVRFETLGLHTITLYVGDSGHKGDERAVARVTINITKFEPNAFDDTDKDGIDDAWEHAHLLDMYDASDRNEDPDGDGYTNYQEYLGADNRAPPLSDDDTDPWDPISKPKFDTIASETPEVEAPFEIWIFIMVLVAAIIIAALIVLIGYLRIHREEEAEKREEAEEEAMLATPQLDIPTMPASMPMVDTSIPTLPQGEEQAQALPPMAEQQYPEQPGPMDMGEAQPAGQPMYEEQQNTGENTLYQGQQ